MLPGPAPVDDRLVPAHSILLIEDNPDDEMLTVRALKKHNIADGLLVARNGEQAVELLLGPGATALPVLVLLDLNLPKMNGLEVLKALRANDRTRMMPVVVLTSSKEDRDLVASYSLGANAYVRKPIDFAQFTDAVGHLSQFWLKLNEVPSSLRP